MQKKFLLAAILTVLILSLCGFSCFASELDLAAEAKNAYDRYASDREIAEDSLFLYESDGAFVAIRKGEVLPTVYTSRREALEDLFEEPTRYTTRVLTLAPTVIPFRYTEGETVSSSNHANGFGTYVSARTQAYSEPIAVKAGQTVVLTSAASQNVAILYECDENGKPLNELLTGKGKGVNTHRYDVTEDMWIGVCGNKGYLPYDQWTVSVSEKELLYMVEEKKAVICFTFDDGNKDDSDVYALFKEKNLVCNFALPTTNGVISRFSQYLQYQSEGFGIVSHSTDGAGMGDGSLDPDLIEKKLKTSKETLVDAGFEVDSWVTPSSAMNKAFLPLAKKYYKSAFTVYLGNWNEDVANGKIPYNTLKDDVHRLYRVSMESTSLERVKQAIDEAVEHVGFLNFYAHGFNKYDTGVSKETVAQILEYVNTYVERGDCIVTTVSEGFDYFYQPDEIAEGAENVATEVEEPSNVAKNSPVEFAYTTEETMTSSKHKAGFGTLVSAITQAYSEPIEVRKGQTVRLTASASGNVAVIYRCDENGKPLKELVIGQGPDVKEFTYEVKEDMLIAVCNNDAYLPYAQWALDITDAK